MIAHAINPLVQYGSVSFDFIISDESGVIPERRLSTELPIDPLPDRAAFIEIIKAVMLGQYEVEEDETIRAAMFSEYYRPDEEHTLSVDRPDAYPELGA